MRADLDPDQCGVIVLSVADDDGAEVQSVLFPTTGKDPFQQAVGGSNRGEECGDDGILSQTRCTHRFRARALD